MHSRHAPWNTGDDRLEYVVIEVFPPEISSKLPPRRPTEEDDSTTGASHHTADDNITAGDNITVDRRAIEPGAPESSQAVDAEYAIFVVTGRGEARVGAATQQIDPGSALTVGYRASLVIAADGAPLEVFVATLNVSLSGHRPSAVRNGEVTR